MENEIEKHTHNSQKEREKTNQQVKFSFGQCVYVRAWSVSVCEFCCNFDWERREEKRRVMMEGQKKTKKEKLDYEKEQG